MTFMGSDSARKVTVQGK